MNILDFVKIIEKEFPLGAAVEGDRVGLQIQSSEEVHNVHIAYELNDAVIDEAISRNADMIIAFHPLIYMPLKSILDDNRVGRLTAKLLKNGISLYIVHTIFDTYKEGTNILFMRALGLEFSSWLEEMPQYENCGMGVIATAKQSLKVEDLVNKVKSLCNSPLKCNKFDDSTPCNRIAIVAGSGSSYISQAIAKDCDVIITGDCTYHKFHEAEGKITIIDPGHSEMEQFVPEGIHSALSRLLQNKLEISYSKLDTNPVVYK